MNDAARLRPNPSWGLAFALSMLLFAAYLPAMQGQFLMSDTRVIAENPRLLSLHGLLSFWSPAPSEVYPAVDQFQPLTYSLLWLEYRLFGLDPRGYQLLSVALHAFNTLLVWGLLARLRIRGAFVAAAVFALHPVQVESVAWIYEQKNVLSGAFFFLSLHAFVSFTATKRRSWLAASLVCFGAALLAKASTVMLPVLILAYAWVREPPLRWRSIAATLPFFGLAALMAATTIWYEGAITGAGGEVYDAGVLERIARSGWILGFQAGKVLFPFDLAFFYPLFSVDPTRATAWIPVAAIAIGLGALWLGRERGTRPALLGVGWFLVMMFPVAGFFDIYYHRFSLVADHFQYLPALGLIVFVVYAAVNAAERFGITLGRANVSRPPAVALLAAVLVVGAFWLLSWQRSAVFANDGLLARDSAAHYPTSWVAFQKSGEYALKATAETNEEAAANRLRAIEDFERAAALKPGHPQIHDSAGVAYLQSGKLDEARRHMQIAVEAEPGNPVFHKNFATVLYLLDEKEWALTEYRAMVETSDGQPAARLLFAQALVSEERFNEAISTLDLAIEATAPLATRSRQQAELLRRARQLRVQTLARVEADAASPADNGTPTWSVLLLTIDTLRPDYLSMNGFEHATSPALDALLGGGIYYEQALAPVPRTTPALASLLTGAYPHVTGVRSLGDALPTEMITLAEAFQSDGYQTLAVVTNMLLGPVRGLAEGFDVYDAAFDVRDAHRTTDTALEKLAATDDTRPLFAWVHYIDPHVPYHPEPEIAADFAPGYSGRFAAGFGRQPRKGEPDEFFLEFPEGLTKSEVAHRNPLSDEENAHIRRLYAGDIRMVDREIDRLVQAVRERFPRTVIVFTADHGESLGEHDFYFDHGDYVYNAATRVPLGFVLPEEHPWHGKGRRDGWVSLVDVAPTLFEVVGREPPPEMSVLFEGRSLAPSLRGDAVPSEPVFSESGTSFFPELVRRRQRNDVAGRFRAVTLGDWKLIWTPFLPDADAWELYDLSNDPDETRNLYRPDHPEVARLRKHLETWLAGEPLGPTPTRQLTPEDREALKKLGYIE